MTQNGGCNSDVEQLVKRLQSGEDSQKTLELLNSLLAAHPAAIKATLQIISLSFLFSFLQGRDDAVVQASCAVLDKLLSLLPAAELVQHGTYMELGLQCGHERLVLSCLQALERHSEEPSVQDLLTEATMLHLLCQTLAGPHLRCVGVAKKVLVAVFPRAVATSMREVLVKELLDLLSRSAEVCLRVYELCVKVFVSSEGPAAIVVQEAGFLSKLLAELETEDVLVKMNILEVLGGLAEEVKGCTFLRNSGILDKLHSELQKTRQDPLGSVVVPVLLRLFCKLCICVGEDAASMAVGLPGFVEVALQSAIDPADVSSWGVAVDTVGLLLSLPASRRALLSQKQAVLADLAKWGHVLVSGSSDQRVRVLGAIQMMVSCKEMLPRWEESLSLRWCLVIHADFFQQVMALARQPFPDLAVAALSVIMAISEWEWGQRQVQPIPGFLEFLLDRGGMASKEGIQVKFQIVCRCVEGAMSQEVWGNVDMLRLRKYQREGPFHQASQTSVTLDNS